MNKVIFLLLLTCSSLSYSKIIKVNECAVSIFGFCPFESIVFTIVGALLFLSLGFPLRKLIKNYFIKQKIKNPQYEEDPILVGIYRYSFHVTVGVLALILLLFLN